MKRTLYTMESVGMILHNLYLFVYVCVGIIFFIDGMLTIVTEVRHHEKYKELPSEQRHFLSFILVLVGLLSAIFWPISLGWRLSYLFRKWLDREKERE